MTAPQGPRFGHETTHSDTFLRVRPREEEPSAHHSPPPKPLCPWQTLFCEALRRHHGVVILACEAARVSKATAYRARRECSAFAQAWDESLQTGEEELEAALYQAAVNGVFEPIYEGQEIIGYIKKRSHAAAVALLKRRRPELFGKQRSAPRQ